MSDTEPASIRRYRKKPVVVSAARWHKIGDHPQDQSETLHDSEGFPYLSEGKIVRRFNRPGADEWEVCKHCKRVMSVHGWIDTFEGGHIVCPGDYVITGIQGEHYPCKPDIFEATYEEVIG